MENTEEEKPKKKKRWKPGVDMREFSGKSWRELEDIWPTDVRLASDVWKVMAVFPAAYEQNKRFQKVLLNGEYLAVRELCQMAWVMRCEEAKQGVATETFWMDRGLELNRRMANIRAGKLSRLGLIEELPSRSFRLYRVSDLGRTVLRNLIEEMEQAHRNIKRWAAEQPEEGKERVNKYLSRFCFEWETLNIDYENP